VGKLVKPIRVLCMVSLCLVVVLSLSVGGMMGCTPKGEKLTKDAKKKEVFIKTAGARCTVGDEAGNTRIEVEQGEWLVFNNELGNDVKLNFSPNQRLFGVVEAISYGQGDKLKIKVLDDAELGEHQFLSDCGTTEPPPVIIVNPPPGGGDG
jgi:hypothetical protein